MSRLLLCDSDVILNAAFSFRAAEAAEGVANEVSHPMAPCLCADIEAFAFVDFR